MRILKVLIGPGKWGDLLTLLAGAVLPIAFAPFSIFILAVLSPAILLASWLLLNPLQSFRRGWFFGVGYFGVGVSWIFISIHEYGNTSAPLAILLTAIFVAGLALFPAIQGYCFNKFFSNSHPSKLNCKILWVFPVTWVLLEWFRSWLLTGFPWLMIAYSQVNSPLKGFIPILGEYGVGFLVIFSSSLLIYLCLNLSNFKRWLIVLGSLAIIWIGGGILATIHWTEPAQKPIKVTMVQGNIPQSLKWSQEQIIPTLKIYYQATEQHWDSNLIIWPEAAIPVPYHYATDFLMQLDQKAKQYNVTLLTGIPVATTDDGFSYYNAIIILGVGSGYYYKRHLVPFGEYVPFDSLLRGIIGLLDIPMSNMVSGPEKQPDLMAGKLIIAPFICYEIAYANDLLQALPKANILVTVSNDAWFGNSLAPFQHLEIGQFRAIQGGRELLFSSNSGITAIVNAQGEIIQQVPQFSRTTLTGWVQPLSGRTPWVYYGNLPILLILWLAFFGVLIFQRLDFKP